MSDKTVLGIIVGVVLALAVGIGVNVAVDSSRKPAGSGVAPLTVNPHPPAYVPPAPAPPRPSTPPAFVEFEDLAGLDAATQRELRERKREGDANERRLKKIEWNLGIINRRLYGHSVLIMPGEGGQAGELGDAPETESGLGVEFGELPPDQEIDQ